VGPRADRPRKRKNSERDTQESRIDGTGAMAEAGRYFGGFPFQNEPSRPPTRHKRRSDGNSGGRKTWDLEEGGARKDATLGHCGGQVRKGAQLTRFETGRRTIPGALTGNSEPGHAEQRTTDSTSADYLPRWGEATKPVTVPQRFGGGAITRRCLWVPVDKVT